MGGFQRSWIHLLLRQETAALHQAIEEELDLLAPNLSRRRYRRVLKALYGFYSPVEFRLRMLAPTAPPLGIPMPERAELLERDLLALGTSWAEIAGMPRCAELPRLRRREHMAGCLYVLEGASLGGQVISRALKRRLGLDRESGAAFFAGAGSETVPRWRRVLCWLEEVTEAGARPEEMVASARETFATLARWARCQGASVARGTEVLPRRPHEL